jgi:Asp-tRNA(Asn)/Glu-tRNA(Gln) amidotransferase A subunit family amidase
VVKASPACHRAVLETVEALRKAGHECVEINPPDGAYSTKLTLLLPVKADLSRFAATEALRLFTALVSADGYENLTRHLGPDKQVRPSICSPAASHAKHRLYQESALFLLTLGPRLPGE